MPQQSPKRVVIVDPQLKDQLGHNYRYAKGLKQLFDCDAIVIANKKYIGADSQLAHVSALSFDQYDNTAFKKTYRSSFLHKVSLLEELVGARVKALHAIWAKGTPFGKLISCLPFLVSIVGLVCGFFYQTYRLVFGYGSAAHRDIAAQELKVAFDNVGLRGGDLVIFQTMLWPTFESLLELNLVLEQPYQVPAIFIVHEDWRIYHSMYGRFTPRNFERRVLESLPFVESKVMSTNQNLSDYCKEWAGYLPTTIEEIGMGSSPVGLQDHEGGSRLSILVPGTYRGDKNFEALPELIGNINQTFRDAVVTMHVSTVANVDFAPHLAEIFRTYQDISVYSDWLVFLQSFDAILIPYGNAYVNRISGILHEARSLNIPVICYNDIADSKWIYDKQLLIDKSQPDAGIASAVTRVINLTVDDQIFENHELSSIVDAFEDSSTWVKRINKPLALHVKPGWTRCGTSVVLDHQLEYLINKGFFVVELHVKAEPWVKSPDQVEYLYGVMQSSRLYTGGSVNRVLLKDLKLSNLLINALNLLFKRKSFTEREADHISWCSLDQSLKKFISRNKIELLFVNHVFNSNFGFRLGVPEISICETHDIQINQTVLRRPYLQDVYVSELESEFKLLDRFNKVVNLNHLEHLIIKDRLGEKAVYIRPPIHKWRTDKRYLSLRELLVSESTLESINKVPEQFDLLIIADGHPANLLSVSRFIDEVFLDLPNTTTLGIVGSVCQFLDINWDDRRFINLHTLGFLDDLANIYDFAGLLVLGDMAGEGIPIKTDQAIANNARFVATEKSLRGYSPEDLNLMGIVACETYEQLISEVKLYLSGANIDAPNLVANYDVPEQYRVQFYESEWDKCLECN